MALGPQIGKSREGYPVYRFTDARTKRETYVVVLPDHRTYYSDVNGKLVATPIDANSPIAAAVLGGMLGFGIGGSPCVFARLRSPQIAPSCFPC
jgi:hypothetical protein